MVHSLAKQIAMRQEAVYDFYSICRRSIGIDGTQAVDLEHAPGYQNLAAEFSAEARRLYWIMMGWPAEDAP